MLKRFHAMFGLGGRVTVEGTGFPGRFLIEELLKKRVIEFVSGFTDLQMSHDGHPHQREITDAIQNFMSNKLVLIS